LALIAAGVLMVIATLLHPSRETATTIVASESRLVSAHVVYTLAWLLVLLGLPGLYAAQRGRMGRLGRLSGSQPYARCDLGDRFRLVLNEVTVVEPDEPLPNCR
jgi:hypothetical protein